MDEHYITADDIYNVDEKGFLIGIALKMHRIMTRKAYEEGRCRQSTQDGNREFITLIACVSALGKVIPPTLLYKGQSRDLQDTWVDDLEDADDMFFGVTENGWTNDAYGLKWLQEVFEPRTRPKRPNSKRLLIVDGHSSHINLQFISWAEAHKIFILILPPHATHRLQPLDVNCFLPLVINYGVELNQWLHKGLGYTSITKRDFLQIFRAAWVKSFSEANIKGGFAKTSIWPMKPRIVLDAIICRPETLPDTQIDSNKPSLTPMTSKSIRRAQKAYRKNPTKENLDLILRSQERLAAQHEIDRHIQSGLLDTLANEKKRRKRGKRLNLVGEEDIGAQLFHSSKVQVAKAYAAEKDAKEQAEKAEKEAKKAQATENKHKKEVKAQEKADKLAVKHATKSQSNVTKEKEKKSLIVILSYKNTSIGSTKSVTFAKHVEIVTEEKGSKMVGTRTRQINLPARFKH